MTHNSSTREVVFLPILQMGNEKPNAQVEEGDLPKVTQLGGTWNSTLFCLTPQPKFVVLYTITVTPLNKRARGRVFQAQFNVSIMTPRIQFFFFFFAILSVFIFG